MPTSPFPLKFIAVVKVQTYIFKTNVAKEWDFASVQIDGMCYRGHCIYKGYGYALLSFLLKQSVNYGFIIIWIYKQK